MDTATDTSRTMRACAPMPVWVELGGCVGPGNSNYVWPHVMGSPFTHIWRYVPRKIVFAVRRVALSTVAMWAVRHAT